MEFKPGDKVRLQVKDDIYPWLENCILTFIRLNTYSRCLALVSYNNQEYFIKTEKLCLYNARIYKTGGNV
jgi:hypothetical protein